MHSMIESAITILGGGPAGTSAALFLSNMGIPSLIIDRSDFPREKVCGDCLGGYAISVLSQIGYDTFCRFVEFDRKVEGKGVHFFSPNARKISIPANLRVNGMIRELAISKRYDFDNFLMEEVRRRNNIQVFTGIEVYSHKRENNWLILFDKNENPLLKTRIAVIAAGSQSKIAAELSGYKPDKRHLSGGLRCYFEGIQGMNEEGYIEFHFLRELLPGYLWIFPLGKGLANVGIGQRSDVISKNGTDLKKMLPLMIDTYPHLRERFVSARMIGTPEGFPLALGSVRRRISGDNYLLAGDSASLIEPFFGEGIGNAMYSGKLAAEHIRKYLGNSDFSARKNHLYDKSVYKKMGKALKLSTWLQKAAFSPGLLDRVFTNTEKKPGLHRLLDEVVNGDMAKHPGKGIKFLIRAITGI